MRSGAWPRISVSTQVTTLTRNASVEPERGDDQMRDREQEAHEDGEPPAAEVVVDDQLHRVEPLGRRAAERPARASQERRDALVKSAVFTSSP